MECGLPSACRLQLHRVHPSVPAALSLLRLSSFTLLAPPLSAAATDCDSASSLTTQVRFRHRRPGVGTSPTRQVSVCPSLLCHVHARRPWPGAIGTGEGSRAALRPPPTLTCCAWWRCPSTDPWCGAALCCVLRCAVWQGSFPLDHFGDCSGGMADYVACVRREGGQAQRCQSLAQSYLQCRMKQSHAQHTAHTRAHSLTHSLSS